MLFSSFSWRTAATTCGVVILMPTRGLHTLNLHPCLSYYPARRWVTATSMTLKCTSPCATFRARLVLLRRHRTLSQVSLSSRKEPLVKTQLLFPTDPACVVSDRPAPPPPLPAAVSQDKKADIGSGKEEEEDIYEYDFPRPVAPPAPTRRAMSDMGGPSTAFSCLSIDGAVEAGTSLQVLSLSHQIFLQVSLR